MMRKITGWLKLNKMTGAVASALLAALLYGINAPFSKMLLAKVPPALMAALMYLGAGLGMFTISLFFNLKKKEKVEADVTKKDILPVIGMIVLDIAAPLLLMYGLRITDASNASLLNNFEIVATSLVALLVYNEAVGGRMWSSIILITAASFLLSINDFGNFSFSLGSLLVLGACVCWGFENNLTRVLSVRNPRHVVVLKGFGSGTGALIIALMAGEIRAGWIYIVLALLLGFVAYGLSIFFYIRAQRDLGAARTSVYYAAAPFIGVLASWIILGETISLQFIAALLIMICGTYLAFTEKHRHTHDHEYMVHEHRHRHDDGHHGHDHDDGDAEEHSHEHAHDEMTHKHIHTPDEHHRHKH